MCLGLISSKKKRKAGQGNKYYFSELGGSLGGFEQSRDKIQLMV